ncbi:septin-2B-like [Cheilinus undulatus]|uniref:septin-2B-like n=1 Tax=Cheilinus undulatus TaxID=241271 RepID=UPI001BD499F0|nr:septin-2B-like [Cheilinus undulatus]
MSLPSDDGGGGAYQTAERIRFTSLPSYDGGGFSFVKPNESGGLQLDPSLKPRSGLRQISSTYEAQDGLGGDLEQYNSNRLDHIKGKCLVHSGSPEVYQLRLKKENTGPLTRLMLGGKQGKSPNKTILLVGETGTGKSTLINALVNHAMGVRWDDDVWFQVTEGSSQCHSKSADVVVYQICGFEGKTLPYSLTIIDTPGYGDTKGIDQDDRVSQRLLDLFHSEGGVHEINAVGLVVKASDNRLSDRLRYIYDSVMSLFGKDLEENIVSLVTHSNGRTPKNVLRALEAANIQCAKDEKNQPIHFLFDNCLDENRTEDVEVLKNAHRITMKGMRQFGEFLNKTAAQNLEMTMNVLKERITLKACIQNLQERIEFTKQREIHQMPKSEKCWWLGGSSLLETLKKNTGDLQRDRDQWLEESYQHVVKLEQIALNTKSLSTHIHLDFLIEKMKEKGDTEKVRRLEEMKKGEDEGTRAGLGYMFGRV